MRTITTILCLLLLSLMTGTSVAEPPCRGQDGLLYPANSHECYPSGLRSGHPQQLAARSQWAEDRPIARQHCRERHPRSERRGFECMQQAKHGWHQMHGSTPLPPVDERLAKRLCRVQNRTDFAAQGECLSDQIRGWTRMHSPTSLPPVAEKTVKRHCIKRHPDDFAAQGNCLRNQMRGK